MSLFEIRAIFSSVQGIDPETAKLVVDETLHVRMSPELALALLQTLRKTLHDYVAMFGSLRPTKTFPPETPEPFKTDPTPQPGSSVDDHATETEAQ